MIKQIEIDTNETSANNSRHNSLLNNATYSIQRNVLMLDEAKRTVPLGVEILEKDLNITNIKLKYGDLRIVIFRMYVPKEKEASLKKWVNDFNSKFNIQVIIQREQGYSGIISLFNKYFSNKDLLTTQDIPTLNLIQRQFFGTPPKITKEYIESRKKINSKLPELPDIPFVAIDDEGTLDPEDAMYVEKINNDTYQLTVAIADISYLVIPRGKLKDYAINLGFTIYGTCTRVSTLGELINYDESHLSDKELTPAWIFRYEIKNGKKTKLIKEPFLAKVKIHEKITPEEISLNTFKNKEQIDLLGFVAKCFRYQRTGSLESLENIRSHNEHNQEVYNANEIISEIIIKTKESFAQFLNKYKSKKAIFKVQKSLSLKKKRDILKELIKFGIDPSSDIFKYPDTLSIVLTLLQNLSFDARITNNEESKKAQKILDDIINTIFKRSYYDNLNRGHAFLNVDSYCDIKGRLAAGIINQIQARNILHGNEKSYSLTEIQRMTKKLNRQIRTYGIKNYTLRFLEMLTSKLSLINSEFLGKVTRIKNDKLFVDIDGFKRWGFIPLDTVKDLKLLRKIEECLAINSKSEIDIKLLGYSLKEQRFLFEII